MYMMYICVCSYYRLRTSDQSIFRGSTLDCISRHTSAHTMALGQFQPPSTYSAYLHVHRLNDIIVTVIQY